MNKLAIVIPYYKIDFFEENLKSLAVQTNKNFTLYIGNDASPENPLALIEKYFTESDFKYFGYQENLGGKNLALQWERILDNVSEDWFQILGDDDMIAENFVEEFYNNLPLAKKENANVLKFSQCFINESGIQTNDFTHYPKISSSKLIWRSKFIDHHRSSLSEHIFSTNSYKKHHFTTFPLAWFSDDLAVLEWSKGQNIIFIDEAKVFVRMSALNISSLTHNDVEKEKARCQYLEIILNKYSHFLTDEELRKEYDFYLYLAWKNKHKSKLKFLPIYLRIKPWFKIFTIPYQKYLLHQNSKIN